MKAFQSVAPENEKSSRISAIVCLTFPQMPANVVCVRRNPQLINRRHIMSDTPAQTKRFAASVPMNIREAVLITTQAMKRIREEAIANEKKKPEPAFVPAVIVPSPKRRGRPRANIIYTKS